MFGVIEGTGFEIIDESFNDCLIGHARVDRLWTGARWSEGPTWFAAGRYLVWSDIPNNCLLRWDETDGTVSVFRNPSNNANGNTVDTQGRLLSCEHLVKRSCRDSLPAILGPQIIMDRRDISVLSALLNEIQDHVHGVLPQIVHKMHYIFPDGYSTVPGITDLQRLKP